MQLPAYLRTYIGEKCARASEVVCVVQARVLATRDLSTQTLLLKVCRMVMKFGSLLEAMSTQLGATRCIALHGQPSLAETVLMALAIPF